MVEDDLSGVAVAALSEPLGREEKRLSGTSLAVVGSNLRSRFVYKRLSREKSSGCDG